jgi:hypothetical protein
MAALREKQSNIEGFVRTGGTLARSRAQRQGGSRVRDVNFSSPGSDPAGGHARPALRDIMANPEAIAFPASAATAAAPWLRVLPVREQGTQRRDERQWLVQWYVVMSLRDLDDRGVSIEETVHVLADFRRHEAAQLAA